MGIIGENSYYYFETPDYEDCYKKVAHVSKLSLALCTAYCGFDLLVERVTKPRNIMTPSYVMGRLVRYNGTPLATVMAGATLTCSIAKLRGNKDDGWNYFLGYSIPAGLIYTNFYKTVQGGYLHSFKGAFAGFLFGAAFALFKKGHIDDWVFVPDQQMYGDIEHTGPFGGDHWGDLRIPWLTWEDPGRTPQGQT